MSEAIGLAKIDVGILGKELEIEADVVDGYFCPPSSCMNMR